MDTHHTYSTKAEKYARYRWDYSPGAIDAIFTVAALTNRSTVADVGAGTGMLTRHFAGRVASMLAIEPNAEMRREAARYLHLQAFSGCAVLGGCSEHLPLLDHCVDLITVAQAIHWCDPEPTRREFARVLKPGGWLALLRNYSTDEAQDKAVGAILTEEYGVSPVKGAPAAYRRPEGFYFGAGYQKMEFPFRCLDDWETFFGSLCSTSFTPDEDHPAFPRFQEAALDVFRRYSEKDRIVVHGVTELLIGPVGG